MNQLGNMQFNTKGKFHLLGPNPPTEKQKCTMKGCRQCITTKVQKKTR